MGERGRRGDWDPLKDVLSDWPVWLFMLGGVPLFPLAWCFWIYGNDDCEGMVERLGDGQQGGIVIVFLWGVLCFLAATGWTCLLHWGSWYPVLVSAAALAAVLFEAITEAAVLVKGRRR
eukprot:COSAG04_NODE_498_length_13385_cov_46.317853_5_plen_119_part_00